MVKSVIGLFVGAVVLCGYIIFQQGQQTRATGTDPLGTVTSDVARAAPQPLLPEGLTEPTEAVAPTPQPPVVTATPVAGLVQAPNSIPEAISPIETDDSTVAMTAANILAGLGVVVDITELVTDRDLQTTDLLAQIGVISGTAPYVPVPTTPLELMIVEFLEQGLSDADIEFQVNEAAIAGELTVPRFLVTSQGRVDTGVLLQAIVTTAQTAATGIQPEAPEIPTGDGSGVEVRVVQRVTETEQYVFYTVAPGDSLGGIATKFYGDVNKYVLIYEANRGVLSSPDRIKVGQRLAVPNLEQL